MLPIPGYINALFILITFVVFFWIIIGLMRSPNVTTQKSANVAGLMLLMWCIFQSTLSLNKWYIDRISEPPHLTFALAGPLVIFTLAMAIPFTRRVLDGLTLFHLTAVHIVRIPVEITLWLLFLQGQIPVSLTWTGFNFDVLIGLSAIVMTLLVWKQKVSTSLLLAWNFIGMIFLGIVVGTAIGAAPTSIQWRDFTQPNYAMIHFPFIWLPSFVVPVVLFSHIMSIRLLLRKAPLTSH